MGIFNSGQNTPKKATWSIFNRNVNDLPDLENVYTLAIARDRYQQIAIAELFSRIIYTALDYVALPDELNKAEFSKTLHNSYSPLKHGLVHHLVTAISQKKTVYLKKEKLQGGSYLFTILNNRDEVEESDLLELNFTKFDQVDLLTEYYGMIFDSIVGAAKSIKTSKSLLFKLKGLSEMIATKESLQAVEAQINQIAKSLRDGDTAWIDGESELESPSVDIKPVESQLQMSYSLVANATGYPMSFINGEIAASLGSTGEGDRKQIRKASIYYFNSILRGVLESVFSVSFEEKADIENLSDLSELLSTVEMTDILTDEGKRKILKQHFALDDRDISLSVGNGATGVSGD